MTKESWLRHMEMITGFLRPSHENGCMASQWKEALSCHARIDPNCPVCKERKKTRRATMNRKVREDVYRSCGLTKVYGAVSGRVYWE